MDNVEIYLNEAILFASEYSELYNESAGDIGDSIIECLTKAVHMVQSFLQKVIDVINNIIGILTRVYRQGILLKIEREIEENGNTALLDKQVQALDCRKSDSAFNKAIYELNKARNRDNFAEIADKIIDKYKAEVDKCYSFMPLRLILKRMALEPKIAVRMKTVLDKDRGVINNIAKGISTTKQYNQLKADVNGAVNDTQFYKFKVKLYSTLTNYIKQEVKLYNEIVVNNFKHKVANITAKMITIDPDELDRKLKENEEKYANSEPADKLQKKIEIAKKLQKRF